MLPMAESEGKQAHSSGLHRKCNETTRILGSVHDYAYPV